MICQGEKNRVKETLSERTRKEEEQEPEEFQITRLVGNLAKFLGTILALSS